jgi:hypothetical protein
MYISELSIIVKARFKIYEHIICNDQQELWQLEHFKNNRTRKLRKLTYNETKKAYRINSIWVTKKRLKKMIILCHEKIIFREQQETPFY